MQYQRVIRVIHSGAFRFGRGLKSSGPSKGTPPREQRPWIPGELQNIEALGFRLIDKRAVRDATRPLAGGVDPSSSFGPLQSTLHSLRSSILRCPIL